MLSETIDYWLLKSYKKILLNCLSNQATVLMFHRVKFGQRTSFDEYINAEEFRLKMKLLKKHFNVISLPFLISSIKAKDIPPMSVVVTIDDGYEDGHSVITPIFDELNIKGAFFIATEGIEKGGLWNDRVSDSIMNSKIKELKLFKDQAPLRLATIEEKLMSWKIIHNTCKFLPVDDRDNILGELELALKFDHKIDKFLSKNQLQEMHEAGMTIGAHTHRHPILALELDDYAYQDIKKSKKALEQIINTQVKYFAYPNGKFGRDFKREHMEMVKELGFEAALTTDVGTVNNDSDLMSLSRYTPWDKEPRSFALRLCHHFYKSK